MAGGTGLKIGQAGCCCGPGGGGETVCPLTITLTDTCNGNPISGATIQAEFSGHFGDMIGETDDAGYFTFPLTGLGATPGNYNLCYNGACITLNYAGLNSAYCDNVVSYCWTFSTLIVTAADPDSTVTASFIPCYDGSTPTWTSVTPGPVGGGIDGSPSPCTFVLNVITLCPYPCQPPWQLVLTATPPQSGCGTPTGSGYLTYCINHTLECGVTEEFLIPQFEFSENYLYSYPLVGCADDGCTVYGPNNRGLIPLTCQVRLTTIDYHCGGGLIPALLFAGDEGVWITLTLSVVSVNNLGCPDGLLYDSGCRSGNGNYLATYGNPLTGGGVPTLNCTLPVVVGPAPIIYDYNSTRVQIGYGLGGIAGFSYTRYGSADCTYGGCVDGDAVSNCDGRLTAGGVLCSPCMNYSASHPDPCVPSDAIGTSDDGSFTIEIRAS